MAGEPTKVGVVMAYYVYIDGSKASTYDTTSESESTDTIYSRLESKGLNLDDYDSNISVEEYNGSRVFPITSTTTSHDLYVNTNIDTFNIRLTTKNAPSEPTPSNPTISQVHIDGVTYDLRDRNAGQGVTEAEKAKLAALPEAAEIPSDIGPKSEVVEEAPAEYVAGKVYFIVEGGGEVNG